MTSLKTEKQLTHEDVVTFLKQNKKIEFEGRTADEIIADLTPEKEVKTKRRYTRKQLKEDNSVKSDNSTVSPESPISDETETVVENEVITQGVVQEVQETSDDEVKNKVSPRKTRKRKAKIDKEKPSDMLKEAYSKKTKRSLEKEMPVLSPGAVENAIDEVESENETFEFDQKIADIDKQIAKRSEKLRKAKEYREKQLKLIKLKMEYNQQIEELQKIN